MRINWLLPCVLAGLTGGLLALVTVVNPRVWASTSQMLTVAKLVVPVCWLLVARWLSRHDDTAGRHAVTTAALVVLVATIGPFTAVHWWWPGLAEELVTYSPLATGPAVFTALVPAAVGWWQRRQDRLADPDADA